MKISRQAFNKGVLPKSKEDIKEHPILLYLRKDYRHAVQIDDIMKGSKCPEYNCYRVLKVLEKGKLIEKKKLKGNSKPFYQTIAVRVNTKRKVSKPKTSKKKKSKK